MTEVSKATIEAARRGEAAAWAAIYDALAPQLLGFLRARRAPEPEDLLGEVLVQMVRDLPRFRGGWPELRAWSFAIARNRLTDDARCRHRRPLQPQPDEALYAHAPTGDAEAEALGHLAGAELLGLLERLTPDQRDVLLLRVVADLSVEETARAMGKRKGAVKTLQHRAVAALRRALEGRP